MMQSGSCWRPIAALGAAVALGACAVGPNYVRPQVDTPAEFKEAQGWKLANPKDQVPRSNWWQVYGDSVLDDLMNQVNVSNQTIKQADAQYRAARALVQSARAAFFPTLALNGAFTRGTSTVTGGVPENSYTAALDAGWELDIWGRLRRAAENAGDAAGASAADLAAAKLSVQAELATDYFELRITDQEISLYDDNVEGQQKSLTITKNQYTVGLAAQSDVAQALTLLRSTQAARIDLNIQRAQLEHAIALLLGKPASTFALPAAPLLVDTPVIPLAVPSELLERRPDIAASERLVAAANANIGVAKAAYFPDLQLTGDIGYQNSTITNLFNLANRFWSVGPSLALNLFDGGARRALTNQAIANYDASVAAYRETVLAAFQDTEDNLVSLRVLADELTVQDEATKAAEDSQKIAMNQYKSGIVSYLNVVVAQTTALANERASLSVRGRQLTSSVALIKSLGGSWGS